MQYTTKSTSVWENTYVKYNTIYSKQSGTAEVVGRRCVLGTFEEGPQIQYPP